MTDLVIERIEPERGPGGHWYTYKAYKAYATILGLVGKGATEHEARTHLDKLLRAEPSNNKAPTKETHVGSFVWTIKNGLFWNHKYIKEGDYFHKDTKAYYEGFEVPGAKYKLEPDEWDLTLDQLAAKYPLTPEQEARYPNAKYGYQRKPAT